MLWHNRAYRPAAQALALTAVVFACGGVVRGETVAAEAAGDEAAAIEVGQPERIEVRPESFELATPRRVMHLVVSGHYADGSVRDLTRAAQMTSGDEAVVAVKQAVAYPAGDGSTQINIAVGGHQLQVPVKVSGQQRDEQVSFNYGALVVLTKQKCNSGACHGSPSGKGGFRLSLRAYDPVLDEQTLVRESYNRRTNIIEPANSLLLQKPLMEIAHGGGKRFDIDDAGYRLLRDWIAQGCQPDQADAPQCVGIEVFPSDRVLRKPAREQQLLVLARFSDGSLRDVTRLADYSSSDEAIATVDADGHVTGHERGEAAILVRYLTNMQTSNLMFLEDVEGFRWNDPPRSNFVDEHVFAKLEQMQILPSGLCSDEEFIRRAYLDVIGILPQVQEVSDFLSDKQPDKRARLIDQLLARPEYAQFWALKWGDLLKLRSKKVGEAGVHKFHRWLVEAVRDDLPYDRFAAELLTAEGSTFRNPAANYYRTSTTTDDCTETTSQLFLGIRIQCAKCHNHPFERWTQDNYYGIGAFFNRVQRKQPKTSDDMTIWVARSGEIRQPRTGEQMSPWLPLEGEAEAEPEADRREKLVEWLRRPDNPFFAKVAVNRIWGHLIGRGIVEPVDDFRDSNPPSNAALLEALAEDFVAHGFSLKHTIRTVLNSRTYQLSSRKNPFNADDEKYFSHARTRMLTAEQLLDAICEVTAVPEKFTGLPVGMRATQLPSPDADNPFLKVFGQPARETACQCERSTESNLSQALQMINGPLVHRKIRDESNRFRKALEAGKPYEQVVRELYLAALCRQPADEELQAALAHIDAAGDPVTGMEDVCWALLNANEFLFQH